MPVVVSLSLLVFLKFKKEQKYYFFFSSTVYSFSQTLFNKSPPINVISETIALRSYVTCVFLPPSSLTFGNANLEPAAVNGCPLLCVFFFFLLFFLDDIFLEEEALLHHCPVTIAMKHSEFLTPSSMAASDVSVILTSHQDDMSNFSAS